MYILTIILFLTVWDIQVFGTTISKAADEIETCETEECYKTANHILKWMNPKVNPCDDFYEFVCGNWRNLPQYEREQYSLGSRGDMVKNLLPVILTDSTIVKESKYFDKLRDFITTCLDEDTIHSLGVTPLQELIQKAGGWPVLDADWSEEDWNFLEAELILGGVLIDVISASIRDYNTSSVRKIIHVGQSRLIRRFTPRLEDLIEGLNNEKTKAYYEKTVDIAVLLGADRSIAEMAMTDALEFETDFIEELTKIPFSNDIITFEELQKAVPWLNMTKLLQFYLPDSFQLLPDTTLYWGDKLFLALKKCNDQYPIETFANYLISKAVFPLLDYVDHDFNFEMEKLKKTMEEEKRFEYCTDVIKNGCLGPAMISYVAHLYENASASATKLTDFIAKMLVEELEEIDWLDETTRREIKTNLSALHIDVGFHKKMLDLEELDKLYKQDEVDTSSFFNFMIYDKKWVKQRDFIWLEKNYIKDVFDLGWTYWIIMGLDVYAHFIMNLNIIDVSGPFLYFLPLYSPGNPAYVNYGHLGFIVAHEFIHAVDMNDRRMSKEEEEPLLHPEPKTWGSNDTRELFKEKAICFVDFYSSFNDTKFTQLKLNGNKTLREDMADNGGLKLSLRAYRKLVDQLGFPERKLPLLQQYSAEQLFMISVVNAFCEIPNKKSRIKSIANDTHTIFEFRMKGMMMNSPDFNEIFNCDKNDPMNPPEKCEVW